MKNFTIWLTGLPCSGKTTIANKLQERLNEGEYLDNGKRFICLDGDDLRNKLNNDLGFSEDDRNENLRRVGYIAQLFNEKKCNVICSFVSPSEELRDSALRNIDNYFLVHVKCSAQKCAERDVKGMWALAKAGKIKMFTGHDAPFTDPIDPHIVVDTEEFDLDQCVQMIINSLN